MKYRLEAIDDNGAALEGIDVTSVQIVPPGGALLFIVPPDTLDRDLDGLRAELHTFFGGRKIGVMRAGAAQVIYFQELMTEQERMARLRECGVFS